MMFVICRIGSLETYWLVDFEVMAVICRIGSLEIHLHRRQAF